MAYFKRWPIGLLLIAAIAALFAITAWRDDPQNDTPPMIPLGMMGIGLVLLGCYLLARWGSYRLGRREDAAEREGRALSHDRLER